MNFDFVRTLRNAFFAGLFVITPIGVTIFVVNFLVKNIGTPIGRFIWLHSTGQELALNSISGYAIRIAAVVFVFACICLLGLFSNYFIGKAIINLGERIINAVPFVSTVYKTVKQITDTFSKQQKAVFQECVLTEYPKEGVWVLGFLTSVTKGEVQEKTGEDLVNVFVPTTPNPTSGFLLMVPKNKIIPLEMNIGDGMKLIISGGAVAPPWPPSAKNLPAKAEPLFTRKSRETNHGE